MHGSFPSRLPQWLPEGAAGVTRLPPAPTRCPVRSGTAVPSRFRLTLRSSCKGTSLCCRRSAAGASLISATTQHDLLHRAASAATITFGARHILDPGYAKTHAVRYVPARAVELEAEAGDDAKAETRNVPKTAGESPSVGDGGAAAEPSVVDFTTDDAIEKLDRLCRPANTDTQFLSLPERRMFTKMIYDKFYKDEGTTVMDPAMLYQASLEVQWVEEWMAGVANARHLSRDGARRAVKTALLERVDLHKPLSYIIGSQPFFGCDIHCEEPLLCPRPETEMWTHWLVYNYLNRVRRSSATEVDNTSGPRLNVLDVCCGTGCIGVALAKHVPGAVVTALDILPQAVTVSQQNAQRNGIPDSRYKAIESDMFEHFLEPGSSSPSTASDTTNEISSAGKEPPVAQDRPLGTMKPEFVGTFDVVVSNPPYVLREQYVELPRSITHWESKMALVGDDYRESRQHLYFKELCVHGAKLLKPRYMRPAALRDTPNMLIEVGLQAHIVADLMEKSGMWRDVSIHLDYAQQERWVSAVSAH
ncbi:putative mitochondrial Mitochondrial N(5)-glutamine methyltransferase MTQ1 [Leptomonas pyrrhocoris]|uniref:Putative mitochondrial Mitochondrial N(5)-glutamine methyltransferase MTQ1 n=1 Tax=Leptomonas pyrrhocoris TaxID=157538 RepID=A0A0N0DWF5_LEPPY|nr:putative mitochondrial Mitochondrial N(5)-glutamine methyltransferase MTQ1 [Leptomonas pyrrhocoris]KPA81504.1 putative mitochondrial Mitochondrial N(5)-glutamine methyltransferase MTQ1 [Leptomonas pyrrhocoris]|eukprot:XP_015659943.1 putative mitochondrial Mitochondrial N(5)-glutamine methyltransferase MTQ1 [Leptomonas pyrrhocoris]